MSIRKDDTKPIENGTPNPSTLLGRANTVSPKGLPSFKPPQDLTLGLPKASVALSAKSHKKFTPNIPTRRDKSNKVSSIMEGGFKNICVYCHLTLDGLDAYIEHLKACKPLEMHLPNNFPHLNSPRTTPRQSVNSEGSELSISSKTDSLSRQILDDMLCYKKYLDSQSLVSSLSVESDCTISEEKVCENKIPSVPFPLSRFEVKEKTDTISSVVYNIQPAREGTNDSDSNLASANTISEDLKASRNKSLEDGSLKTVSPEPLNPPIAYSVFTNTKDNTKKYIVSGDSGKKLSLKFRLLLENIFGSYSFSYRKIILTQIEPICRKYVEAAGKVEVTLSQVNNNIVLLVKKIDTELSSSGEVNMVISKSKKSQKEVLEEDPAIDTEPSSSREVNMVISESKKLQKEVFEEDPAIDTEPSSSREVNMVTSKSKKSQKEVLEEDPAIDTEPSSSREVNMVISKSKKSQKEVLEKDPAKEFMRSVQYSIEEGSVVLEYLSSRENIKDGQGVVTREQDKDHASSLSAISPQCFPKRDSANMFVSPMEHLSLEVVVNTEGNSCNQLCTDGSKDMIGVSYPSRSTWRCNRDGPIRSRTRSSYFRQRQHRAWNGLEGISGMEHSEKVTSSGICLKSKRRGTVGRGRGSGRCGRKRNQPAERKRVNLGGENEVLVGIGLPQGQSRNDRVPQIDGEIEKEDSFDLGKINGKEKPEFHSKVTSELRMLRSFKEPAAERKDYLPVDDLLVESVVIQGENLVGQGGFQGFEEKETEKTVALQQALLKIQHRMSQMQVSANDISCKGASRRKQPRRGVGRGRRMLTEEQINSERRVSGGEDVAEPSEIPLQLLGMLKTRSQSRRDSKRKIPAPGDSERDQNVDSDSRESKKGREEHPNRRDTPNHFAVTDEGIGAVCESDTSSREAAKLEMMTSLNLMPTILPKDNINLPKDNIKMPETLRVLTKRHHPESVNAEKENDNRMEGTERDQKTFDGDTSKPHVKESQPKKRYSELRRVRIYNSTSDDKHLGNRTPSGKKMRSEEGKSSVKTSTPIGKEDGVEDSASSNSLQAVTAEEKLMLKHLRNKNILANHKENSEVIEKTSKALSGEINSDLPPAMHSTMERRILSGDITPTGMITMTEKEANINPSIHNIAKETQSKFTSPNMRGNKDIALLKLMKALSVNLGYRCDSREFLQDHSLHIDSSVSALVSEKGRNESAASKDYIHLSKDSKMKESRKQSGKEQCKYYTRKEKTSVSNPIPKCSPEENEKIQILETVQESDPIFANSRPEKFQSTAENLEEIGKGLDQSTATIDERKNGAEDVQIIQKVVVLDTDSTSVSNPIPKCSPEENENIQILETVLESDPIVANSCPEKFQSTVENLEEIGKGLNQGTATIDERKNDAEEAVHIIQKVVVFDTNSTTNYVGKYGTEDVQIIQVVDQATATIDTGENGDEGVESDLELVVLDSDSATIDARKKDTEDVQIIKEFLVLAGEEHGPNITELQSSTNEVRSTRGNSAPSKPRAMVPPQIRKVKVDYQDAESDNLIRNKIISVRSRMKSKLKEFLTEEPVDVFNIERFPEELASPVCRSDLSQDSLPPTSSSPVVVSCIELVQNLVKEEAKDSPHRSKSASNSSGKGHKSLIGTLNVNLGYKCDSPEFLLEINRGHCMPSLLKPSPISVAPKQSSTSNSPIHLPKSSISDEKISENCIISHLNLVAKSLGKNILISPAHGAEPKTIILGTSDPKKTESKMVRVNYNKKCPSKMCVNCLCNGQRGLYYESST